LPITANITSWRAAQYRNWWWMCWSSLVELCMSIQCRCIFTMFIPASFFNYKIVFSQFRLGGWVMK
jgi:hypothetical protein